MDEIIKFLKSFGLGDKEIEKVLRETPVNPQGLTGTNVATGVFKKTDPKSKELVKDFPLVVERIGNPFEVNYYKGKSREETIKMAEDNVKFLENEITKLADQILNKNLKLSEEQKINLTKNLATKRKIEKDLETFKATPEAPVVDIKTGETVKDVETLKEKSGLVAPPTTELGRIDLRNKQMLQKAEEFYKSQDDFQKEEVKRQALIAKQYEGKGYEGGVFGPSGMYRSVARNFLLDQHAKGKIKLTDDVIKNLEERNYISGGQPLLYPDPIRIMRLHYGDDVFEKIPLDKIKTGAPSEIIEEMSKIKVNPVKVEAPATPGGYMTPGEIQANIEELENIERMIKRRESRFADMTDEQIKNELEHYGSQKNAFEIAFGYDHPKEYEEYLKLKNLEDPKKFAKGGSVESLGLDYLTGQDSKVERENYKFGSYKSLRKRDDIVSPVAEPITSTPSISNLEISNLENKYREFARVPKSIFLSSLESGLGGIPDLYNLYRSRIEGKANGGRIGYAEGSPMAGAVYVGSWEGPWTGPEFLGGPRKGQYYNSSGGFTAVGAESPTTSTPLPPITTTSTPEEDVLNRYRAYLASANSSSSNLENRYRELIKSTPATGLPVSIPTPVNEGTTLIKGGLSFISPEGEKITFGSLTGFRKPNGESYTGPIPKNIQNFSRMVAADGGRAGYAEGGDAPSITLDSHKEKKLGPEDPLSKYKSYSEEELLGNIEAKRPNQLQSFSLEEYQLNTMPMIKPKDIVPKGTTNTMPIEEFLKRRYQLDLAKGGSVGLGYLMGE